MKQIVYADNAATTKLDSDAFEAMKPYMLEEYGNPSQPYAFSRLTKQAIKDAREKIAFCIGADPEEIVFTSGGTESDNWAIKCFCQPGKNVITSEFEHHAVLNACIAVKRHGYTVRYIKPDKQGFVQPSELQNTISNNTGLVSIMLGNNEIGTIQPIKELASIAHGKGVIFHTDAVQAVGHIPINVHELDVDMLSSSAHKYNGPRGIGFLYIKHGISAKPFMDGGSQEMNLRAGTENVAAIVGMSVALEKNCRAIKQNEQYLLGLEQRLESALNAKSVDYRRNGGENHLPGLMSLSFPGYSGEMILHRLDLMGIEISTGSACDGHKDQISHVLKAISLDKELAEGTIRISLGKYNTEEEVDCISNALCSVISK